MRCRVTTRNRGGRLHAALAAATVAALTLVSCGEPEPEQPDATETQPDDPDPDAGCDGTITQDEIEIWWHDGLEAEADTMRAFVEEFNATQDDVTATLTLVPEAGYPAELRLAAATGTLPDVVDVDASFAFAYAWSGQLQPIDGCLDAELREDLLPSILAQGTYNDQLWAVGMFESGLGIYALRSALEQVDARIPAQPADAWSIDEFDALLSDLRAAGYEQPLDAKRNYEQGEFLSYLYQPMLWSAGADLVDPDVTTAEGWINAPEAVEAVSRIQAWHTDGYVHPNEEDQAFVEGEAALSMVGHWELERYLDAHGEDLLLLPLPDFGTGTVSAQGSWQWAVNADTDADAAWTFIEYTLQPEQVERMAEAGGAIPSRTSVADDSARFGPGGPGELFLTQLEDGYTRPRLPHPVYPELTRTFAMTMINILDGGDVASLLDMAAAMIDGDLEANRGYAVVD